MFFYKNFRHGVSLVEIVIALSVAAVAFFPIITMMRTGLSTNMSQANYVQASELAQNAMDEIMALKFADIAEGKNNITYNGITYPRRIIKRRAKFDIDVEVKSIPPVFTYREKNLVGDIIPPMSKLPSEYVAKDELKEIEVVVKWRGVGKELEFSLKSYRADLHD